MFSNSLKPEERVKWTDRKKNITHPDSSMGIQDVRRPSPPQQTESRIGLLYKAKSSLMDGLAPALE